MARKKRLTSILAATLLALGVTVAAPALAASQPSFTGYDTAAALSESDSDATASTYEALEDQVLNEGQIAVVSYEGGASGVCLSRSIIANILILFIFINYSR